MEDVSKDYFEGLQGADRQLAKAASFAHRYGSTIQPSEENIRGLEHQTSTFALMYGMTDEEKIKRFLCGAKFVAAQLGLKFLSVAENLASATAAWKKVYKLLLYGRGAKALRHDLLLQALETENRTYNSYSKYSPNNLKLLKGRQRYRKAFLRRRFKLGKIKYPFEA